MSGVQSLVDARHVVILSALNPKAHHRHHSLIGSVPKRVVIEACVNGHLPVPTNPAFPGKQLQQLSLRIGRTGRSELLGECWPFTYSQDSDFYPPSLIPYRHCSYSRIIVRIRGSI